MSSPGFALHRKALLALVADLIENVAIALPATRDRSGAKHKWRPPCS